MIPKVFIIRRYILYIRTKQGIYTFVPSYMYVRTYLYIYYYLLFYFIRTNEEMTTRSAGSGRSFRRFGRCSFDEEVHIYIYSLDVKLNFHRRSVNFDVDHRLLRRRVCVVLPSEVACV
ncbi:predicted protein [Micromonas commoda]|uniref:Uncharacterized protein n=1 Tax=Micromonas commoda (strain RCC299 / NOUM17 / CCMP2709) TaxID=296587 RepID=C1FE95_MICCC|nr:predicted protein [Micromonas commoda]ACO68523.1 predicted protein [Micromonas commoda]|eukprot:XP_002507265.1 predicted protein [Micromonas commoda]